MKRQVPLQTIIVGAWLDYMLLVSAAIACFATPLLVLRALTVWPVAVQNVAAFAFAAGCAVCVYALRYRNLGPALMRMVEPLPLWSIVLLGLALRLAWNIAFPAEPGSDAATYWGLARRLASAEPYAIAGTRAYWPVGYPLYLSLWIKILGTTKSAWLASNFAAYLAAVTGIAMLGRRLDGPRAGNLAAFVFAVWPNLIANTATPEKETLLIALLPWMTWFLIDGINRRSAGFLAAAGVLLGYATLVQPSLQLLLPALAVAVIGLIGHRAHAMAGAVAFLVAAAVVLAPWAVRNYLLFERFVLVSTNGGGNLYRANNPLATGGYTDTGAVSLANLSEIDQDAQGRRLAIAWIRAHPMQFAKLALEKQLRFTGDDSAGIYATLKVGKARATERTYVAMKAAANAFWLLAWIVLAALALQVVKRASPLPALARLPFWFWLYLLALHSAFESGGKYHIPATWVLCVLSGVYAAAATRGTDANR
jgi:hypothetical protein